MKNKPGYTSSSVPLAIILVQKFSLAIAMPNNHRIKNFIGTEKHGKQNIERNEYPSQMYKLGN